MTWRQFIKETDYRNIGFVIGFIPEEQRELFQDKKRQAFEIF